MSDEKDSPTPPSQTNMQDFAGMIGAAVSQGIAEQNPKKVTFGQYQKRMNAGRPLLRRECYQNGYRMEPHSLTIEEINLLNRITHTGRYIDRTVEVLVREEGVDEIVEIRFACKTADQRFALARNVRSLEDMLKQIVDVQVAEDQEEREEEAYRASKPRRHFGDNKAFREAQAKAAQD